MERREYAAFKAEAREVYGLTVGTFQSALWQSYKRRGEPLELVLPPRKVK